MSILSLLHIAAVLVVLVSAAPHFDKNSHAGIIPNTLNRDPKGVNSKAIIDLNHCINEKQRAKIDVDNARSSLGLCEREATSLRNEEERCRLEMHGLAGKIEHLQQENEMLKLKLRHAEDKDVSCSQRLSEQVKESDMRVRAVVDHRPSSGFDASMVSPSDAQHREQWEVKLQRLEARLLEAAKDAEGLRAQKRSLESAVLDLSHEVVVARRSASRSLSNSIGSEDQEGDEAITRHQLRESSKGLTSDEGVAVPEIVFHERSSDEEHAAHLKREEELLWKVRGDALGQQRQQADSEARMERLRRLAEGEIDHEDPSDDPSY